MLRKFLFFFVLLALIYPPFSLEAAPSAQPAHQAPALLLPDSTFFYLELHSQRFSPSLQSLLENIAPFSLNADMAEQLLQSTPYADAAAWIGDRIAIGVFSPFDPADAAFSDLLPTVVILLEVADQDAADAFAAQASDAALRLPNYVVLGSPRGLRVVEQLSQQMAYPAPLFMSSSFNRLQAAFSPDLSLWIYSRMDESGLALYANEVQMSVEIASQGEIPANGVPVPLRHEALEGVPIGALVVDAGMNLDLGLENAMQGLRDLAAQLEQFNPTAADLPLDPDSLLRGLLGLNFEEDILPLFNGGYAFYITRSPTLAELDSGFILAPRETETAGFTLVRLTNRLSQTGNLTIQLTDDSQYTVLFDSEVLPDVVYGIADNRLYLSTRKGAQSILFALQGQNLTDDPRWRRVLQIAPDGTQHIRYLNLREMVDLLGVGLDQNFTSGLSILDRLLDYLRRFESAAIFYRQSADGIFLTRYSLLFD